MYECRVRCTYIRSCLPQVRLHCTGIEGENRRFTRNDALFVFSHWIAAVDPGLESGPLLTHPNTGFLSRQPNFLFNRIKKTSPSQAYHTPSPPPPPKKNKKQEALIQLYSGKGCNSNRQRHSTQSEAANLSSLRACVPHTNDVPIFKDQVRYQEKKKDGCSRKVVPVLIQSGSAKKYITAENVGGPKGA